MHAGTSRDRIPDAGARDNALTETLAHAYARTERSTVFHRFAARTPAPPVPCLPRHRCTAPAPPLDMGRPHGLEVTVAWCGGRTATPRVVRRREDGRPAKLLAPRRWISEPAGRRITEGASAAAPAGGRAGPALLVPESDRPGRVKPKVGGGPGRAEPCRPARRAIMPVMVAVAGRPGDSARSRCAGPGRSRALAGPSPQPGPRRLGGRAPGPSAGRRRAGGPPPSGFESLAPRRPAIRAQCPSGCEIAAVSGSRPPPGPPGTPRVGGGAAARAEPGRPEPSQAPQQIPRIGRSEPSRPGHARPGPARPIGTAERVPPGERAGSI
jgi:hypothetical protein